jgi:2-polyprenyl-3-methyl-5-hydroxy-6-metoxy-1,4-benzoquinol methylase/organic radical activating enzyme
MALSTKGKAELEFWRGMVAELTRDCATDDEKRAALLRVCREKTYPRYRQTLGVADDAFTGLRLLDIGCGPHGGLIGFTGCERHGVDPLIDAYREIGYPLDEHGVTYHTAGSEAMPFDDDFFDVVICVNALDHVDDLDDTVREISRVLKPGGRFLGQLNFHSGAVCEPICLSEETVRRHFGAHGLSIGTLHYQASIHTYAEDRYLCEAVKTGAPGPHRGFVEKVLHRAPESATHHAIDDQPGLWKLQDDPFLLFRLVPTMRCNYRCKYCFVTLEEKTGKQPTMFDEHPVEEWISAMRNFSNFDVEFYGWGGEPFILDGVYDMLAAWTAMDHVGYGNRLDTNMSFTDKIAARCPSDKIKLNCSWHTQYDTLDTITAKVKKLRALDMVGMVNFVASPLNMETLTHEYKLTLDELVDHFAQLDVFLNVAADFSIVHADRRNPANAIYQRMILRHVTLEEWKFQRSEMGGGQCTANRHFLTIHPNGDLKVCLTDRKVGNFFTGELTLPTDEYCSLDCPSLVSYPFRTDNPYPYRQHLVEFVKRNKAHYEQVKIQESYAGGHVPDWPTVRKAMEKHRKLNM